MRVRRVWTVAIASLAAACGGGGNGGGGTGPDRVFTTLVVQPASATVIVGQTTPLTAIARDQNNSNMSGLTVTWQSNNTSIATVNASGVVTGVAAGTATITANGTVGSVTKSGNATVTVSATAPQSAIVVATAATTFDPASVTIARNGTVTWQFNLEHNVTWSGSGTPANIPNTSTGTVSRTFPNAGTFNYGCTLHPGMNGSVTVVQ